ncbi:DUF418 domain-containing protein [Rummeliibacillus sp. NPDC094406]|uniref:DUF418 domain-containing protein n=1 Tax=Rummeliibacillus sp. NPDC094406 TaxID=3364511 RepID=UPI003823A1E1
MQTARIHLIDSLRGFSLLGILLANMLIFQYGIFGKDEINHFDLSNFDYGSYKFIQIFIEETFLPIFTFLFGFSLIKLVESLHNRGYHSRWFLVRRFLMLLTMGLLHSAFLWEGDILTFYGLFGFLLLFFIKRKPKTLIIWAIISFVLTIPFGYGQLEETNLDTQLTSDYIEKSKLIYGDGSYSQIYDFRNNEEDPLSGMLDENPVIIFFILMITPILSAPLFLLGMAAAKLNLFSDPHKLLATYKKWVLLIPVGVALKAWGHLMENSNWSGIGLIIGGPILALGYIAAFSHLYTKHSSHFLFRGFESIGKLSLTNYIMQTIICTTLFYGYGFGWFENFGTFNSIILGIIIIAIQGYISTLYLKKFKRGPLEIILRIVTNFSWNGKVRIRSEKV